MTEKAASPGTSVVPPPPAEAVQDCTIREVETIPLHVPFREPFKFSGMKESTERFGREYVEVLVVRIHTDQGVHGIGETQAWRRQGSAEVLRNLVVTIREHFEPLLVGRSPFQISAALHALNETMHGSLNAQAAISDALYDLVGKLLGVPVYQLLGGKCREVVRVGVVLSAKPDVEALLDSAQAFYDRGFRHFGLKIGLDAAADLRAVERLRAHFGDKVVLRVDANASMSFDAALMLLKKLESFDIDAAEQPVALWDLEGMARLSRAVAIPIMADESVSSAALAAGGNPQGRRQRGADQDRQERRAAPGAQAVESGRKRRHAHLPRQSSQHQHRHGVRGAPVRRLAHAADGGRVRHGGERRPGDGYRAGSDRARGRPGARARRARSGHGAGRGAHPPAARGSLAALRPQAERTRYFRHRGGAPAATTLRVQRAAGRTRPSVGCTPPHRRSRSPTASVPRWAVPYSIRLLA